MQDHGRLKSRLRPMRGLIQLRCARVISAEARRAVETGAATSVSSYIADAVNAKAARERALAELAWVFDGPPPAEALDWARNTLRGEPHTRPA